MLRPAHSFALCVAITTSLGVVVAVACGGSDTPEQPPPVCYASHPVPDGGMIRPLRATEWAQLALGGFSSGSTTTNDCDGNAIQWRPTERGCDLHEDEHEAAPRAQAVTEESVVVGRSDSAVRKPVWVMTHRFENGDGFGPIVVTERDAEGVSVRAIGTLRLPPERARLRLRTSGGQQFVVADGERCEGTASEAEDSDERHCTRYARILPVVGDEVMNPEVRTEGGHCLGPAQIYLNRESTLPLENGWERTFRLAASTEYRGHAIVIHEQVTVEDRDPRDPGRPARLFRTADADRVIYLNRGGMRSGGVSLFERTVQAHGSTQLPIAESSQNEEHSGSRRGGQAR